MRVQLGCLSAPGTIGKNSGVLDLPIRPALGEPLPGVAPINLQLSPSPDSGRAFGLAPFHGRRDPREGIGGGHHGFRIHIDERLGEDPAARPGSESASPVLAPMHSVRS